MRWVWAVKQRLGPPGLRGVEGGVFTCGFGAGSDQLLSVTVLGDRKSV